MGMIIPKKKNLNTNDIPEDDHGEDIDIPEYDHGEDIDIPEDDNGEDIDIPEDDNGEDIESETHVPKILTNMTKASMIEECEEKYSFYMMTTLSNFLDLLIPIDVCRRNGLYLYIEDDSIRSISADASNVFIAKTHIRLEDITSYLFDVGSSSEFSYLMSDKDKASSILSGIGRDSNVEIYVRRNGNNKLIISYNGLMTSFSSIPKSDGDITSSEKSRNVDLQKHMPPNEAIIDSSKFLLYNGLISKKLKNDGKMNIGYALYEDKNGEKVFAIMDGDSLYMTKNSFDFDAFDTTNMVSDIKKFDSSELKDYVYNNNALSRFSRDFTNRIKDAVGADVDMKLNIGFDTMMVIRTDNMAFIFGHRPMDSSD